MPLPGETRSPTAHHESDTLPLFRPEALAARQQKDYGEVILIRPLSLMLLGWFALGITTAILGFLLLGQYTERGHVSGIVTATRAAGSPSKAPSMEAELYVPGRWTSKLRPGSELSLRCGTCPAQFARQSAIVMTVSDAPLGSAERAYVDPELAGPSSGIPMYKVKVSLPPPAAQLAQINSLPQTGTRVEAEIPLGRKPLIKWLFERSGS
jgi:hypothetical protein